jgi:Meiotically up-regulated gene 113
VIPVPGTCTARWATTNAGHQAGDICAAPAVEEIGDSELCRHHYNRAMKWFYERKIELPLRYQRQLEESRRKAAEEARLAAEARSIVYFLRRGDGIIKIGFSASYPSRLNSLQAKHGPLRLLLAYAGGRKEESEAHDRYASLCVGGEWFRPSVPMLLDVQRLRRTWATRPNRLPEQVTVSEIRALVKAMRQELVA